MAHWRGPVHPAHQLARYRGPVRKFALGCQFQNVDDGNIAAGAFALSPPLEGAYNPTRVHKGMIARCTALRDGTTAPAGARCFRRSISVHPRFPQVGTVAYQFQRLYSRVETIGVSVGAETHDRPLYWWHVWQPCCPRVGVRFPLPNDSRSRSDLASNYSPFRTGLFDLFQPDLPARASTPNRRRERISKPAKIVSGLIFAFCNAKPRTSPDSVRGI